MQIAAPQMPDSVGTFAKGALKGLLTGAMVMGLFYGGWAAMLAAGLTSVAIPAGVAMFAALGVFTSSMMGGINAVTNGGHAHQHEAQSGMIRGAHVVQASQNAAPVILPAAAIAADRAHGHEAEHAPSRQWAESVGHRGDRMQEILHNGSMSDKDRASAILREREERHAAPQAASL